MQFRQLTAFSCAFLAHIFSVGCTTSSSEVIAELEKSERGGAIVELSGYFDNSGSEPAVYPDLTDVGITQEGKCISVLPDPSYDGPAWQGFFGRKVTLVGRLYGSWELLRPDGLAPLFANYCGAEVVLVATELRL